MKFSIVLLSMLATLTLSACSPESSESRKTTYDIKVPYKQVGYHPGAKPIFGTYFVYVNLDGVANNVAYISLKNIAMKLCEDKNICFVHFWDNEAKAGHSIPMTDSEANSLIASYNINRNTGNNQFQCQSFTEPGQRCAK